VGGTQRATFPDVVPAPTSPRLYATRRLQIVFVGALILAAAAALVVVGLLGIYLRYEHIVDRRLSGERGSEPTRLYSRPLTLRRGQTVSPDDLARRLNALRYEERPDGTLDPGQFVRAHGSITLRPREAPPGSPAPARAPPGPVEVTFDGDRLAEIRGTDKGSDQLALEPELISTMVDGARDKRRMVHYEDLPAHLVQCVLAAEDRRFFQHPGVDLFRTAAAAVRNMEAESYVQGGSTITQQLVKNFFLTPQKTIRRKVQEALLAFVLERRASKREILQLYVNDVYLGQVGSFGVRGVGEAARLFFQKDVTNLGLHESALLAGLIQSPNRYNPYRHPDDARARRNAVLHAAQIAGLVDEGEVAAATRAPLDVARETIDVSEAPYFVDFVKTELRQVFPSRSLTDGFRVQTTLDPYLQAVAQQTLVDGLHQAEAAARKKRRSTPPAGSLQGALVALEPATGAVVALVGGRSYAASQFDRATQALRQPGSTFKPFVYLTAFETSFDDPGLPPLTPATLVEDAPATFYSEQGPYTPDNDQSHYLGFVTLRRALAMSLNVATLKVAEVVGHERIAALLSKLLGRTMTPYPALSLGAFEATPMEMAGAFAVLASGGWRVMPTGLGAVEDARGADLLPPRPAPTRVARAESTFLVTSMLRSVLNEGTASRARGMGFKADAAGKTGTTDDNHDAWFIGYTPTLLCAVWVGYDDNASLRLSGAEAALPIWTEFMKRATAGTKTAGFTTPKGVIFADIDAESGLLATDRCPHVIKEAFIAGAVPLERCLWHADF
jgi:penicillin-binding protein 1B